MKQLTIDLKGCHTACIHVENIDDPLYDVWATHISEVQKYTNHDPVRGAAISLIITGNLFYSKNQDRQVYFVTDDFDTQPIKDYFQKMELPCTVYLDPVDKFVMWCDCTNNCWWVCRDNGNRPLVQTMNQEIEFATYQKATDWCNKHGLPYICESDPNQLEKTKQLLMEQLEHAVVDRCSVCNRIMPTYRTDTGRLCHECQPKTKKRCYRIRFI